MANKPITERTIPKDDNTGYVPMDAGLETVPPMDMGPDDDSELSMATTDDNEKKNRSKRTYQEIYEDAQVAMDKLLPDIASLNIKVINETDELKKVALTKQLSRMENKWEKH